MVQDHPHRAGTDLRGIRCCSLRHGSILSKLGASGKPSAVQGRDPGGLVDAGKERAVGRALLATLPGVHRDGGKNQQRERAQKEQHDAPEQADAGHHGAGLAVAARM